MKTKNEKSEIIFTKNDLEKAIISYCKQDPDADEYLLESFDTFYNSDLNLEPAELLGATFDYDGETLKTNSKSLGIIKDIMLMDDYQHMGLFKELQLFHDGGDDFDYAGSYYYILHDILEIAITAK